MKKVIVALGIMLSLGMGSCLLTNAPVVPAVSAASIEVDRSSAWFDQSSRTFGADVTFNGEPMTVAYWCISNGEVENVYQRKNGSDWVFIGTRGPGNNDYHFPSQDSVSLFIKVGNVAAQSQGYDDDEDKILFDSFKLLMELSFQAAFYRHGKGIDLDVSF